MRSDVSVLRVSSKVKQHWPLHLALDVGPGPWPTPIRHRHHDQQQPYKDLYIRAPPEYAIVSY
jgi:hypothetical protein